MRKLFGIVVILVDIYLFKKHQSNVSTMLKANNTHIKNVINDVFIVDFEQIHTFY